MRHTRYSPSSGSGTRLVLEDSREPAEAHPIPPWRGHGKLQRWTAASGYHPAGTDVFDALESFHHWLMGYAEYHATMVAELLGGVFFALNRVVWERVVICCRLRA